MSAYLGERVVVVAENNHKHMRTRFRGQRVMGGGGSKQHPQKRAYVLVEGGGWWWQWWTTHPWKQAYTLVEGGGPGGWWWQWQTMCHPWQRACSLIFAHFRGWHVVGGARWWWQQQQMTCHPRKWANSLVLKGGGKCVLVSKRMKEIWQAYLILSSSVTRFEEYGGAQYLLSLWWQRQTTCHPRKRAHSLVSRVEGAVCVSHWKKKRIWWAYHIYSSSVTHFERYGGCGVCQYLPLLETRGGGIELGQKRWRRRGEPLLVTFWH